MSDVRQRATELLQLHSDGLVVLPTVWDAWSARAVVEAGFAAISIGSHPLAESRGQSDQEGMSIEDALDGIARVCAAVDVPVTADVESGYGLAPRELVERIIEAGAAGVNVEDTVHSQDRIRSVEEHADYIAGLRTAADDLGVDLVINARTDALLHGEAKFADPLAEAVQRIQACEQAGARCVYPVKIPDVASLQTLLAAVTIPLNVTADPLLGAPSGSLASLRSMGVGRITFGPLLQLQVGNWITATTARWR